jgi:hypothetical protein
MSSKLKILLFIFSGLLQPSAGYGLLQPSTGYGLLQPGAGYGFLVHEVS